MALIQVNYLSKALFRTVPLHVILPADRFDEDANEYLVKDGHSFKTLYLLHGLLGNYTDWVSNTRIQKWAEEKELAVVMPSGDNSFYYRSRTPWNDYEAFIGEEIVEITRKMFPLSDKREDTFIAGLSMGGYGALRNGMVFSDTFGAIAGLSSAIHIFQNTSEEAYAGLFEDLEEASQTDLNPWVAAKELLIEKRRIPRVYMACGTKDEFFKVNTDFRDFLRANGIYVTWDEEDCGHEWDFWDSQIKKVIDWLL